MTIDIVLSRKCNQKCYYCTTYTKNQSYTVGIIELEKIFKDLKTLDFKIKITGGEPGLCKNLEDVITLSLKYFGTIEMYSNGLARVQYPDIIENENIKYFEHLFLDYDKKFYELKPFEENNLNNINVIVVTKNTLQFYDKSLVHRNTWFKSINNKCGNNIDISGYIDFFKKIKDKTFKNVDINNFINKNSTKLCSYNTPVPFILIEENKIGHCDKVLNISQKIYYSFENLKKLKQRKLFSYAEYCKNCIDPEFIKLKDIL